MQANKVEIRSSFCMVMVACGLVGVLGGCGLLGINVVPETTEASVQFYTVPIFCESDDAGELVQSTYITLHNPESGPLTVYRRAVLVGSESDPLPDGVVWGEQILASDLAVRLDCDSFARILTDDPNTSFNDEFASGTRVDGFLTIGIEGSSEFARLDTSIQYSQPDGSFTIDPIMPSLVVVDAWPPSVTP